jgi:hypothetical protein
VKGFRPSVPLMVSLSEHGIGSLGNGLRGVDSAYGAGLNTHDHLALFF